MDIGEVRNHLKVPTLLDWDVHPSSPLSGEPLGGTQPQATGLAAQTIPDEPDRVVGASTLRHASSLPATFVRDTRTPRQPQRKPSIVSAPWP